MSSQHENEVIYGKKIICPPHCSVFLELMIWILALIGTVDLFTLIVISWQTYHLQNFLSLAQVILAIATFSFHITYTFIFFTNISPISLSHDKFRLLLSCKEHYQPLLGGIVPEPWIPLRLHYHIGVSNVDGG
jgi:hypothetical protein